ncbi:unnamed protein product [Lactuca saligna]|uniref:Uncharacterized protein n=1 Tax=Lactuca saligna TaxID=75948 RepID=A0AA36DWN2_LACSI|nr:unnamed protein product [Lactuca saligna]
MIEDNLMIFEFFEEAQSRISDSRKRKLQVYERKNENSRNTEEETRYEVGGLTYYRNRVASGCAANASAIAATTDDVDVLSGGDSGASYVIGDPAG